MIANKGNKFVENYNNTRITEKHQFIAFFSAGKYQPRNGRRLYHRQDWSFSKKVSSDRVSTNERCAGRAARRHLDDITQGSENANARKLGEAADTTECREAVHNNVPAHWPCSKHISANFKKVVDQTDKLRYSIQNISNSA